MKPGSNEKCTGLAKIARLGPTLWLKIPIRALKLAHNLGQCAIFRFGFKVWNGGRAQVAAFYSAMVDQGLGSIPDRISDAADTCSANQLCTLDETYACANYPAQMKEHPNPITSMPGLLAQGVLGGPTGPLLAPRRGPLGSSPDRESPIGNAPALVPGLLAPL
jgi:hypothetical protein